MSALYLQALRTSLPQELVVQVDELCKSQSTEALLETLIRFTVGGEPATDASTQTREEWTFKQSAAKKALDDLTLLNGRKRAREDDAADPEHSNAIKRPKLPEIQSTVDDPPVFTLQSISATSPVRKKLDITIHKSSIKFVHPSSHAIEAVIPLSSLKRGFILPTRGKQKAHWTVVILSSDAPERGKAPSAVASPQIIFGLDAIASTAMTTATYSPSSKPITNSIAKGAETLPFIHKLLSHVDTPILQPTPDVFRSACAGNANTNASTGGVPGIEAYLHAKPGSLWFMKEGILWGESKPCEFWAVDDLMGKTDGLRMLSATGRTCSVILTRKDAEAEDDDDAGIETEFAMVDGKEQEGINQWVRNHRHLFGQKPAQTGKDDPASQISASVNATTINAAQLGDESDASDESFDVDSDSDDGGSATSSDSSQDEGGNATGSSSESAEGEETDEDGNQEDDLRPENHPLMRPGAMPRMSRAAIDAVVGMVNDDLMGGGSEGEDELSDD